ncbi:MAG: lamin tail domain-containing protein [Verrucomicrobiota bacterium]
MPVIRADSVVVFNEIMYHPGTNAAGGEWLELHNQMAVDVDLSGWSITNGVSYTFPEG